MEELQRRHRREQRDLQDRITQKKKGATKKTRKGVNDECEELLRQLASKQQQEIAELDGGEAQSSGGDDDSDTNGGHDPEKDTKKTTSEDDVSKLAKHLNSTPISPSGDGANAGSRTKKPNRQKARLARRAAEQDAVAVDAAAEAAAMPDRRAQERKQMELEANTRGLVERQVRSDGHCLYAAVADQLERVGVPLERAELADYLAVRRDAADFIKKHCDDFEPFLEEPLDQYVHKIRATAEWGGHLELLALARKYQVRIQVLQGNGRVEAIEGGQPEKEIWLAYYRHAFGLGEHYNSLRKKTEGSVAQD